MADMTEVLIGVSVIIGAAAILAAARWVFQWLRRPRLAVQAETEWSDLRLSITNPRLSVPARRVRVVVESWRDPDELGAVTTRGGRLRWTRLSGESELDIQPGETESVDFLYFLSLARSGRKPYEFDPEFLHRGSARLCLAGKDREVRFFARGEDVPSAGGATTSRSALFRVRVSGEPPVRPATYEIMVAYFGGAPFRAPEETPDGSALSERTSVAIQSS